MLGSGRIRKREAVEQAVTRRSATPSSRWPRWRRKVPKSRRRCRAGEVKPGEKDGAVKPTAARRTAASSMRPRGEGRRRRAGGRAMNGGASSMRPRGELRRVELPAVRRTRCQAGCRAKNPSGACFGRQSTSSRHRGWLGDFIAMVLISFKLRQVRTILIYRVNQK